MELQRDGDKTYLLHLERISDNHFRKRKKGYFYMSDGKFYFQFQGTSFQMSHSKKYEASLKLIDIPNKSWISVNTDRKGRRVDISKSNYFPLIMKALEYEIADAIIS